MKKILILWLVILAGLGFIAYTKLGLKPNPDQLIDTGNLSGTQAQTTNQTQTKPTNETFSSLIYQGDQFYKREYYDEALKYYQKALSIDPQSTETLQKTGMSELYLGNAEKALGYFEKIKETSPSIQMDILIGRSYLCQRQIEQAKNIFDALDYSDNEVKYYRAILDILYKNHDTAKEIFGELSKLDTETQPETKNLKDKSQIFLTAYAQIDATKGIKQQHSDTILAKALIDAKEFEASIPLLFNAINSQSDYRDAWVLLGYSYLKSNKITDAIDSFLQAKTLDPNKPETLFFLGLSYAIQDRLDDAVFYFKKAEQTGFQPVVQVEQKLADIYLLQQKYEDAINYYDKVINLNTDDISIFTKATWICIEKLNRPMKAIYFGEKAVQSHPAEAMSYNLRGWGFVAASDYDKAKPDLNKALSLDPSLASAYLNFGWMLEKQSDIATAKEYYKKAYALSPGSSVSNLAAVRFNNITKKTIDSSFQANITSQP